MLRAGGLSPWESAATGEDALALVAQRPPDLILLDIMMPGMDGYAVLQKLKGDTATRNIPKSSWSPRWMIVAPAMLGLNSGAEDFLTKPVDRAELCARDGETCCASSLMGTTTTATVAGVLEDQVGSRTADLGVENARLYFDTFNAAPVGVVHVGMDGRWLRINQRLCDLLGYSREELLDVAVQQLVKSEQPAGVAHSLAALAAGTVERHVIDEQRFRRCDGGWMWARVNMSVHRDAVGEARHFIAVIEDITERRTLEAQVRQTSKMDAIGQLASGVAHDFNNLLTVILSYAELMTTAAATESSHREDLGQIIGATQRAAGLTKQLLAFARQQVLRSVPLDMNALITAMTGMLGRLIGEHITVTLVLDPDLSLAFADKGQLEQVVMNLVVNARDAMPGGGTVTIETDDIDLDSSFVHDEVITPGNYVMLTVSDTGTGMTEETRQRLFEPFFTTKDADRGTGLGLSTTYGIVKQSKGYISVHSEMGRGTTFKVYLPRSDDYVPVQPVVGVSP